MSRASTFFLVGVAKQTWRAGTSPTLARRGDVERVSYSAAARLGLASADTM